MKRKRRRSHRPGRGIWVQAARQALIEGGIEAVKIDRLATMLGATRGSFYYHFANREALLEALLEDWRRSNTQPFEDIVGHKRRTGREELDALAAMWLEEENYSPAYDSAVRDWARVDARVAKCVRRIDRRRIAIIERIFRDLGYRGVDAFVRARITYFHQVGYYTLGLAESRRRRRELAPHYIRALLD